MPSTENTARTPRSSTVTYRGPKDPLDGSTAVEVDGRTFRLGIPVEDVPATLLERLKGEDLKGHKFTVSTDKPANGGN